MLLQVFGEEVLTPYLEDVQLQKNKSLETKDDPMLLTGKGDESQIKKHV